MKLQKYQNQAVMPAADGQAVELQVMPVISAQLERSVGFWERLFPSDTSLEIQQSHLALLKIHNEHVERSLDAFCRARYATLEHSLRNHVLKGLAAMNAERQLFFQEQQRMLISSLNALASGFISEMMESLTKIREIPDPIIRQSEEQRIYAHIGRFNRTENRLLDEFLALLDIQFAGSPRKK
jgi:hypothetical protein